MNFKLLQREPTLWIAGLNALIMIIGTVGLKAINQDNALAFVVVVNAIFACANAFAVRPISPVTFTYAISALVALGASYNLHLPPDTIVQLNMAVVPVLAFLTRGAVSPVATPISRESTKVETAREAGAPGTTAVGTDAERVVPADAKIA